LDIILITLKIATVAILINVPIAIWLAYLLTKLGLKLRFIIEILISLPLALPPVVTGYALLIVLSPNSLIGDMFHRLVGQDIVFTWVAASLASAIVSFPLTIRPIIISFDNIDEILIRSSRSLGAGPYRTFINLIIPLSYNSILAGGLLGFTRALGEFGATIMVAGNIPGVTQTLPLAIYKKVQLGNDTGAFGLILLSLLIAVLSIGMHNWLITRSRITNT
jgi:molybdate transport system permease protein